MLAFPCEYLATELSETLPEKGKDQAIMDTTFTVADLYAAFQSRDLSCGLIYAAASFKKAYSGSPEDIESFIKTAHMLVAKHLVMASSTQVLAAGHYRKEDSASGTQAGTIIIPFIASDAAMREYCVNLQAKLKALDRKELPIEDVALFAMTGFGRLHPFKTGNGRMGRVLMNCVLLSQGYMPVTFEDRMKSKDDKEKYDAAKREYYNAFDQYLKGNRAPLSKLFQERLKPYDLRDSVIDKPIDRIALDDYRLVSFKSGSLSLYDAKLNRMFSLDEAKARELAVTASNSMISNFFNGLCEIGYLNGARNAYTEARLGYLLYKGHGAHSTLKIA